MPAHQSEMAIAARCLFHPQSLAALALLAINDHVLKGVGSAWLTGKLSDFAGLFYFPFLVAVLVAAVMGGRGRGRLAAGRLSFWFVGLWFAAVKTLPAAHESTVWLASLIVGAVEVTRDPTDVIALLAMVPAWRLYQRSARAPELRWRAAHAPGLCVFVLLTAATSRPRVPEVKSLVEHQGKTYAQVVNEPRERSNWTAYSSEDGLSWRREPSVSEELFRDHVPRTRLDTGSGESVILRGRELYAGSGERVWSVPQGRDSFMRVAGGHRWAFADIAELPSRPGVVAVAAGSEGVVVGRKGAWTRVAVGKAQPSPLRTTSGGALAMVLETQWAFVIAVALAAAAFFSLLSWLTPRRREEVGARVRPAHRWAAVRQRVRAARAAFAKIDLGCAFAATLAIGCAAALFAIGDWTPDLGIVVVPVAVGVAIVALALGWARDSRFRPVRIGRLGGATLLGATVGIGVMMAWDMDWIHTLHAARLLALLGAVTIAVSLR